MVNLTKVVAGLLIAAALVLGAFAWMLARHAPSAPIVQPLPGSMQALTPVVVATRTLAAGQPIPADALRLQPLPIHPAGSIGDTALVAGRVPLADIAAESPVLDTELSSSLATSIQPGERAIAVRVDEINAVGYQIRPGNFVDVFFTLRRDGSANGGGEVGRTQARLLVSKARVLVFGNPADAAPSSGSGQRTSNFGTQSVAPRTAVIAVPVTQVDTLALAQSQGQLILALRNPTDDDTVEPSAFGAYPGVIKVVSHDAPQPSTLAAQGVALDQFAGGNAPREPAPPVAHRSAAPAGGGGVEVIRGGRAETVAW
jgi:pilus assembly protein CpaB